MRTDLKYDRAYADGYGRMDHAPRVGDTVDPRTFGLDWPHAARITSVFLEPGRGNGSLGLLLVERNGRERRAEVRLEFPPIN